VTTREVVTLPVVVHVVYFDESQNITDAQIESQIEVLNEDFRKSNPDFASIVPPQFLDVAADVELEFCLANRDPQGNPSDGITRTATNVPLIGITNDIFYNNQGGASAWESSEYINIWVCDMGEGLNGVATFPGEANAAEDGLIVNYRFFGRNGSAEAPYALGHTTTHEIGHYLGLNHVWGSGIVGNCDSDDGIADTPLSSATYQNACPDFFESSCNSSDMYMNFMYYTDDACLAMFTEGQKARMLSTLESDRAGLLASKGCMPVSVEEVDKAIQWSIYPNPASDILNIQLVGENEMMEGFSLFDMTGQRVLCKHAIASAYQIDVAHLPKGIYIIQVNQEQSNYYKQILIQ